MGIEMIVVGIVLFWLAAASGYVTYHQYLLELDLGRLRAEFQEYQARMDDDLHTAMVAAFDRIEKVTSERHQEHMEILRRQAR